MQSWDLNISLCYFFRLLLFQFLLDWTDSSVLLTQVENLTDAASLLPFPRPNCQQGYCQFGPDKHQDILQACRLSFFMLVMFHY